MCCSNRNSKKNEGVMIVMDETLSSDYSDKKTISKEDLRIILNKIYILEYNMKLYDKRNLQAQRAKELKSGLNKNYVELVKKAKKLEDDISEAVRIQVLETFKVPSESFESTLASSDSGEIIEASLMNLYKAIRNNKKKLGLSEARFIQLTNNYDNTYDKCNFLLTSSPECAQQLSEIYDDNQSISYIQLVVADSLYYEYSLLPIEVQAFIEDISSH